MKLSQILAGCSKELIKKYAEYVVNDYKDKIIAGKPKFLSVSHIKATEEQLLKMGYVKLH